MTESDYLSATNYAKVKVAQTILADILLDTPEERAMWGEAYEALHKIAVHLSQQMKRL